MKSPNKTADPITITNQEARQFLLDHHFLLPPKMLTAEQILPCIFSRLGCIQFDTINVVGRNADLVLQSRVKDYSPNILDELLYQDRLLMDGWDKVASIYATKDWPYFERHRKEMGNNRHRRSKEASNATSKILKKINANGPASSLDFKDSSKTDWAWGPTNVTRAALEILYAEGKLGIHHRINTRRHFDLIQRLLPAEILETPNPNRTEEEYQDWHVMRRIGGLGIASLKSGEHWLGIYGANNVAGRKKIIQRLLDKGILSLISIEGSTEQDFFIRAEDLERFNNSKKQFIVKGAAFIAPLDNLLWNRKLISEIFSFKYTWEVYKPKEKREYGYYVLPVLFDQEFIARVDMIYDRKAQALKLINWWWETNTRVNQEILSAAGNCMHDFLKYLGAKSLELSRESQNTPGILKTFRELS